MKKTVAFISTVILLSALSVNAAVYPTAFWNLNDKYNEALECGNTDSVISYATQICALLEGRKDKASVETLASKYCELARAYESTGKYASAGESYGMAIPYIEAAAEYGAENSELLYEAYAGKARYKSEFDVYISDHTVSEDSLSDVMFGVNYGSELFSSLENDSITLIEYLPKSETVEDVIEKVSLAADSGCAVVLAPHFTELIHSEDISAKSDELISFVSTLDSVGTDIYLILGTKVNTRLFAEEAEEYISAFRSAADIIHQNSENVHTVWNPVCGIEQSTPAHGFYPGDEYVDYIGVDLYITSAEVRGGFVTAIKELMDMYGDRKPFIVTESGIVSTKIVNPEGEDTEADQLYNAYISLMAFYPKVKGIIWRDSGFRTFDADAFAKSECGSDGNYVKLADGFETSRTHSELCSFAFFSGSKEITVKYYIDGEEIGSVSKAPYTLVVDFSEYTTGEHIISASALADGVEYSHRDYNVSINDSVSVYLNGAPIYFNSYPITQSGTTFVPVRTVASMLGGTVEWQPLTQAVTVKRGALSVKMHIGDTHVDVNGRIVELPYPVRLVGSVTYVPLRALCEIMGADVIWDGVNNRVDITE